MPDLSTCHSPTCGIIVDGNVATCPKCGGPMRAVRESRKRGWLLLVVGLFLILFMGAITLSLAPSLLSPGQDVGDGSSFSGTAEQARMILGLFGLIILFGITSAAYGIFQIATGRESKLFIIVTLGLAALLVVFVIVSTRKLSEADKPALSAIAAPAAPA